MAELPKRKPTRLKGYDYSQNGAYFVTVCTDMGKQVLGDISVGKGLAPSENCLSEYGKIAEEQLMGLEQRYDFIKIQKYVIMPNHIHIIIMIMRDEAAGASPCPTLSDVICTYKSLTTRLCKKSGYNEKRLFQRSFHDHIIRNERDYQKIWEYIETNPIRWKEDCFYPGQAEREQSL